MMIQLDTERLILRNYRDTDLNDVHDYFSNEEVARYEDFDPMTVEEVKEEIREWKDMDNRLVVELKESNKVIGSIGYWIDEDGDYSIDYDFNPAYKKQGYATEAGQELLKYLFNEVGINQIYGDCDIRNVNSWKLLERLDFKRIKQIDNESYKDDAAGNPLLISIYIYLLQSGDIGN
ncbi:Protein N-acetyltransferase, RimJ/RimL family [Anaerosporobacter mobilis DSM 15930]|uniref:Protein N-acetyltransferase, RimJ/RimL family n=1 Tax=Anaerosporobacter mobilis DSM 15930 TaxID=1120996 RepID=A0A1M7KMR7_9FIRM|nr:GNAT family N-acetyltransferase [Anaerosporobacter mobilis]SHM66678.1 Protein N-acetyltransferase, RimJ/RimL family [Anaerosporobacter mobilis DSM 15930]